MIDSQALFAAKRQLSQFLEEHPEAAPLQQEIDNELKKAGPSAPNRIAILSMLMRYQLAKLSEAFSSLSAAATDQDRN
jgi:hypothetical protein